jgi:hypothetical protein
VKLHCSSCDTYCLISLYTVDSICMYMWQCAIISPGFTSALSKNHWSFGQVFLRSQKAAYWTSAHLSTSQLREAAGNCQRSWAASSNQSQKGSRRRVPPQDDSRILRSWSKKCRFSGFSRFNLWSTLTPEEFDVKTLISWLASPLAHWDSNCPIETWHKSVLSTLKTC